SCQSWSRHPSLVLRASRTSSSSSNSIRLAQRGDLFRAEAEFLEYGVGMLPELRRRSREPARRTRQRDRLAGHAQCGLALGLNRLRNAELHDLRVGINLVDRVDQIGRASCRERVERSEVVE